MVCKVLGLSLNKTNDHTCYVELIDTFPTYTVSCFGGNLCCKKELISIMLKM